MPNTVIALRSSGVASNTPSLGVIANGELSLNFADGILYYKTTSNTLGTIKTSTPGGLNQEIQFNDSGSFGGDSGLRYNKTTNTLTTDNVVANTAITVGTGVGGIISGANIIYSNTISVGTIDGDVVLSGNIVPDADDTHYLGNANFTFAAGHFDDLYVDGTIYVRAAVNLADSDRVDFGTSQDVKLYYDGTLNQMNVELQGDSTMLKITDNNTDRFIFYKANGDFYATGNVVSQGVNLLTFAQGGFNKANTANITGEAAFSQANSANVLAQAAFDKANTANVTAEAAYSKANSANVLAQSAFNTANAAATVADILALSIALG